MICNEMRGLRRWPVRRLYGRACLVAVLCLIPAVLPACAVAGTKSKTQKIAQDRIAEGEVVNAARQPLEGAVVYLEDPNSLAIKSYLSNHGGHFHFDHLQPETDYEVWAEQNGVESKHQFISQFNSKPSFDFTLQIPPKHKFLGFL